MKNLFKSKKYDEQELVNQVVGGQSVLFKIFQEIFKENPEEVQKIELTYFALSVFTYIFLRLTPITEEEKGIVTDRVADAVLWKSIPYADKNMSMDDAIKGYQVRYGEFNALINGIFKENGIDAHSCTTLTMHVYESVMGKSAQEKMIEITLASSLIAQFIVDNTEFIKEKSIYQVTDAVELYINKAVEHKNKGRLPEAIEAYSEAFDFLLMEAKNFAQKNVGYIDNGETRSVPKEYFDAIQNYLRRDENAARISNNGGVLFAQMGDYETAEKWFQQAIELHPEGQYQEASQNLENLKS